MRAIIIGMVRIVADNFYVTRIVHRIWIDWESRNHIPTTNSKMEGYHVRTTLKPTSTRMEKVNLERPKVLYNKKTNKSHMWLIFENKKII